MASETAATKTITGDVENTRVLFRQVMNDIMPQIVSETDESEWWDKMAAFFEFWDNLGIKVVRGDDNEFVVTEHGRKI